MKSNLGEITWKSHNELGVKIVENQAEWTPMQRQFLMLGADEYGPDVPNTPNTPNTPNI